MKYMLDTNICVYLINKHPPQVIQKFKKIVDGHITMSSIVLSELMYGAYKSVHQEKNFNALEKLGLAIPVLPYDHLAAKCFGEIRTPLENNGHTIGAYDLMIAAHALSIDAILVTNNLREFKRVKNLRCENWV